MNSDLVKKAKELRKNSTDAEKILWHHLRAKQLGAKFRRQEPIGKYIVDFVCYSKRLVLEIDGGQHALAENSIEDKKRDFFLNSQGFKVLRFWNNDVLKNTEGVIKKILDEII
ncbi:MAG: endonuclease domain-containing protein [Desulfococcaceae bacterium]